MSDSTLRNAIARAIADGFGEDCDQSVMFRQMNFVGAADAVLGKEFAHGRPASMPDMSGRQQWTIVGGPYGSLDVAERMAKTRPVVKDQPVTVLSRIVSEWEEADDD